MLIAAVLAVCSCQRDHSHKAPFRATPEDATRIGTAVLQLRAAGCVRHVECAARFDTGARGTALCGNRGAPRHRMAAFRSCHGSRHRLSRGGCEYPPGLRGAGREGATPRASQYACHEPCRRLRRHAEECGARDCSRFGALVLGNSACGSSCVGARGHGGSRREPKSEDRLWHERRSHRIAGLDLVMLVALTPVVHAQTNEGSSTDRNQ